MVKPKFHLFILYRCVPEEHKLYAQGMKTLVIRLLGMLFFSLFLNLPLLSDDFLLRFCQSFYRAID